MALICKIPAGALYTRLPLRRPFLAPLASTSPWSAGRSRVFVSAARKVSQGKNRRGSLSTQEQQVREEDGNPGWDSIGPASDAPESPISAADDGFVMPELPGQEPDFWEGPQWDAFGFFIQYLWAFGVGFALIACGIAAVTYNNGATDFKETPTYKESVESSKLLGGPDVSEDSDVFESNPTEVAPSLAD
ncbi:hypothetical protein DM860_010322 [Cuscuta australis]|uniref:Uncharacterized protein n=1 Tax=Cuscuta australis TaxID=267555 RepID=A0A328DAQ7_9ASTE|nr:hypothetical protein DM860_010322 [Cuscuta australis]